MHIAPMPNSNMFMLDHDEISMLLKGEFRSRKCLECDGTGWIQVQDGSIVGTGYKRDWLHEDPIEWITPEGCDECHAFGQIITFTG